MLVHLPTNYFPDGSETAKSTITCVVILLAGHQQERVPLTFDILDGNSWGHAYADNLTTFIDVKTINEL